MSEFQHGDAGKSDSFVTSFQRYDVQKLTGVLVRVTQLNDGTDERRVGRLIIRVVLA